LLFWRFVLRGYLGGVGQGEGGGRVESPPVFPGRASGGAAANRNKKQNRETGGRHSHGHGDRRPRFHRLFACVGQFDRDWWLPRGDDTETPTRRSLTHFSPLLAHTHSALTSRGVTGWDGARAQEFGCHPSVPCGPTAHLFHPSGTSGSHLHLEGGKMTSDK